MMQQGKHLACGTWFHRDQSSSFMSFSLCRPFLNGWIRYVNKRYISAKANSRIANDMDATKLCISRKKSAIVPQSSLLGCFWSLPPSLTVSLSCFVQGLDAILSSERRVNGHVCVSLQVPACLPARKDSAATVLMRLKVSLAALLVRVELCQIVIFI